MARSEPVERAIPIRLNLDEERACREQADLHRSPLSQWAIGRYMIRNFPKPRDSRTARQYIVTYVSDIAQQAAVFTTETRDTLLQRAGHPPRPRSDAATARLTSGLMGQLKLAGLHAAEPETIEWETNADPMTDLIFRADKAYNAIELELERYTRIEVIKSSTRRRLNTHEGEVWLFDCHLELWPTDCYYAVDGELVERIELRDRLGGSVLLLGAQVHCGCSTAMDHVHYLHSRSLPVERDEQIRIGLRQLLHNIEAI